MRQLHVLLPESSKHLLTKVKGKLTFNQVNAFWFEWHTSSFEKYVYGPARLRHQIII